MTSHHGSTLEKINQKRSDVASEKPLHRAIQCPIVRKLESKYDLSKTKPNDVLRSEGKWPETKFVCINIELTVDQYYYLVSDACTSAAIT